MQPTPGRIVLATYPNGESWPAIVTKAGEDNLVSLTVFEEGGERRLQRVPYAHDARPASAYRVTVWDWPPRA